MTKYDHYQCMYIYFRWVSGISSVTDPYVWSTGLKYLSYTNLTERYPSSQK